MATPQLLSTEQIDHINGVLALKAPGTQYGRISVKNARRQLAGEGFDGVQIDAMLDLRMIEVKHTHEAQGGHDAK